MGGKRNRQNYRKRFFKDQFTMFGDAPKEIKGVPPVKWTSLPRELADRFRAVLKTSQDEKPLQKFFEENPAALLMGIERPHTAFVLPRQNLPKPGGGWWTPDFLICDWTSIGPIWTVVELESPNAIVTSTKGLSAGFLHARQQIEDYRSHALQHTELLRAGGWPGLDANCKACIVIGRSTNYDETNRQRLANLRGQRIEVASYDRLLLTVEEWIEALQRTIKKMRSRKRP
ncbi:MAG TPA: Shedu anti-phage system protein SduA domain-containing protein [Candidatus Angelobacter sp.]